MAFFDRMKDKFSAAGKGAKKLTRLAQLKLDLHVAEGHLEERFKALGKACAHRFLERKEPSVEAAESAIGTCLEDIRRARRRVEELRQEMEQVRSD